MFDTRSSGNAGRFVMLGFLAVLTMALVFVAGSTDAQTQAPAAPSYLAAYSAHTEGEIILYWDAVEGATQYRVCRRLQDPPGIWGCLGSTDNSALLTRLQVGSVYDFSVAAYDGFFYSSLVRTEALVEVRELDYGPVTGLVIPDGYLSVGESTTHVLGQTFTLTGITPKASVTLGDSDFPSLAGRQYVKVCGTVTALGDYVDSFLPGINNNLVTDHGIGFRVPDDDVTDWLDVGAVPVGEARSGCDVWEVAAGSGTVFYAVNNWLEHPGVYRVELFADE